MTATAVQRKVLRYLLDHPGDDVLDYYDSTRRIGYGMARVSQRGAAGRMLWALVEAGYVEAPNRLGVPVVTSEGERQASA